MDKFLKNKIKKVIPTKMFLKYKYKKIFKKIRFKESEII